MSDNLHTIFSGSECPPHSVLFGYFRQTLTEEEMHRVEQHLTDCEMCSDELDGLSKMKNPADLDLIVEELTEQIGRKRGRILSMSRNYALMAAAALLILILGSVAVVRMLTRTEVPELKTVHMDLADRPGPEAVEPPPAPAKSRSLALSSGPAKPDREKNGSAVSRMQAPVVQNDQEQIASTDVAAGDTDKDREMITAEETVATGGVAAAINADSAAANTVISEYLAPSAFQAEAKKAAAMEAGMDEFAAGQYKNAAVFFEQVKDSQPGNYKAVYHLAYCYFSEKQYKKALETLAPILKDKENDFYKEASVLSDTIKTMNNR
jgi:tetratricopeptide (TPR) repeat protein